jgi:REP element-mobilizing transposase RayT
MARKPRIEFPGALYHVISCGNQGQLKFHSNADRIAYLDRLEHYRRFYRIKVCACVLMSNHVHVLVERGDTALSKFMQVVQFTYSSVK